MVSVGKHSLGERKEFCVHRNKEKK
jgi:hypothetical protein